MQLKIDVAPIIAYTSYTPWWEGATVAAGNRCNTKFEPADLRRQQSSAVAKSCHPESCLD